jgi:hypothetical protein
MKEDPYIDVLPQNISLGSKGYLKMKREPTPFKRIMHRATQVRMRSSGRAHTS